MQFSIIPNHSLVCVGTVGVFCNVSQQSGVCKFFFVLDRNTWNYIIISIWSEYLIPYKCVQKKLFRNNFTKNVKSSVGWGWDKRHLLHLCRRIRPPQPKYPAYDIKIWWWGSFIAFAPGTILTIVVGPDRVLSMGQIELCKQMTDVKMWLLHSNTWNYLIVCKQMIHSK